MENYQHLLREGDDYCADIFGTVTAALVQEFQIDISRQCPDSTHIYSYMARLTRSNLMAVTIKRFFTQVLRHDPASHAALPEDLIQRYAPTEGPHLRQRQNQSQLCNYPCDFGFWISGFCIASDFVLK